MRRGDIFQANFIFTLEAIMKTMKVSVYLAVLIIGGFTISRADNSFGCISGNLASAEAIGYGVGYLGVFGGFGDNANSVFGSASYGFSKYTDGRVKLGFSDADNSGSDPRLFIAADFKYQFMNYSNQNRRQPLDMAVGGFTEFSDYGPFTIFQLGGNLIGSIPYRFSSGARLIPYGRLDFRLERWSFPGFSDSDFRAGLNLGAKYELSPDMNIYGEIQIDGNTGLFTGIEFRAF
jgi:hypothetical protein